MSLPQKDALDFRYYYILNSTLDTIEAKQNGTKNV